MTSMRNIGLKKPRNNYFSKLKARPGMTFKCCRLNMPTHSSQMRIFFEKCRKPHLNQESILEVCKTFLVSN